MIAEVTTAALMSENKHLANPCTTDSTPTSANQEDHVSMAAHAARRLLRMNKNLNVILGVEAMCGAQGIEFRTPLQTSGPLMAAMTKLRAQVPTIVEDRYMAPSIEAAAALVEDGTFTASVDLPAYVKGELE
jgi:histidine ammonia-lyase